MQIEQKKSKEEQFLEQIEKYNSFQARNSHFGEGAPQSPMTRSMFKGVYNLFYVFLTVMLIKKYVMDGYIFLPSLQDSIGSDLVIVLLQWPLICAYSYVVVPIERRFAKTKNVQEKRILSYIVYIALFTYTSLIPSSRGWCTTHTGFFCMLTMVFFMKMYSYQRMNSIYAKIGQENNELRKTYRINYPANLTVSNFTDFLCIPVIVYQCEYPRNDRTRPTILVTRFAQFIILLNTCALLISDYIIPTAQQLSVLTYYQVFWKLSLPLYCFFIILFLIVWEVILGFFAELTKFADREFYQDFWNSTHYEQFSRKWNRPVYSFLYRHIFQEMQIFLRWPKWASQIGTILVSAILHEYIFTVLFRSFYPFMTILMLAQIPYMKISLYIKGTYLGRIEFWRGLLHGIPLIATEYLKSSDAVAKYYAK